MTKGRIFFRAVPSLFVNNVSLSKNLTSERCFTTVAVLRSQNASPLMKSFVTPGG